MNWRFLYKPRWLLGHLVIILFCVVFIKCAIWQYHRLENREASNRNTHAQLNAVAFPLTNRGDANSVSDYRHVLLTGRWDFADTVFKRYPLQDGVSGYDVLTPFVLSNGDAYIINRGFVTIDAGNAVAKSSLQAEGLSGVTTIQGMALKSEHSHKDIETTPNASPISTITATDINKLSTIVEGHPLASKWVQLTQLGPELVDGNAATSPPNDNSTATTVKAGEAVVSASESADKNVPELLDGPDLTNGPHRGYTLQWTAFTILAIIGWGVVLWRESEEHLSDVEVA